MNRWTFPDFGSELRRPFEIDENCYDCAELYRGCRARPVGQGTHCRDFLRLLDVMPGTYGQTFPPSRMQGLTEAGKKKNATEQIPEPSARAERETRAIRARPAGTNQQPRRPSPASIPIGGKQRLCGCGALLQKRKRCCATCRAQRRRETLSGRRSRKRSPAASDVASDMPVNAHGGPSTLTLRAAHN